MSDAAHNLQSTGTERGGGPTTIVGSLDMADEKSRGVLRRSLGYQNNHKRWAEVTPERKTRYVAALDVAIDLAIESRDARGIRGCVDTLAKLEGQNQADEHLAEKYERLDTGKPTEAHAVIDAREATRQLMEQPTAYAKMIEAADMMRYSDGTTPQP